MVPIGSMSRRNASDHAALKPRTARARAAKARKPAPRRQSLYTQAYRRRLAHLDDLIPEVLSVVAPHVEALEEDGHPVAALMGDRLRRSLVRLEPMLDQTLDELKLLREADASLAAHQTNLRESMTDALELLATHDMASPSPEMVDGLLSAPSEDSLVMGLNLWDELLAELEDGSALPLRKRLHEHLERYVMARHAELHARLVLMDTHRVLRAALMEVTRVGRSCEKAFPSVAGRVERRSIASMAAEPVTSRFDVH
jgi:hypothetical protein